MSCTAHKYGKGGALHRKGSAVFYSPTGDPLRDAWNSGEGRHPGKQRPLLATKRKPSLTKSKLTKSKLKLYYEIWKESQVDGVGDPVEEDKGKEGEVKEDEAPPGVKPELQYSRNELYEIQKEPLSQIKPEFLADFPIQAKFSFVKGVWEGVSGGAPPARERWPRSVTPNEHDGYDNKMRRGDNSRMSRGKDGQQDPNYILSPQRRSFNSGCYMTGSNTQGPRENKVMDRENMGQAQGRRTYGPGERAGQGRTASWSDPAAGGEATTFVAPNLMPDYTQRRDPPPLLSQGSGGMFDRGGRGYGEGKYDNKRMNSRNNGEYSNRNNGEYHRNSGGDYSRNGGDYNNRNDYGNGRYNGMNGNDRRQRNSSERNHGHDLWDEPEWFAEPTTQNDVIELRGFYDDDREGSSPEKNRKSSSNSTSESEREHRKSSSSSSGGVEKEQRPPSAEDKSGHAGGPTLKFGPGEPNLDDLLSNLDTLPDLLANGTAAGANSNAGGSRFSRWFRKESPTIPDTNSPSPHHMINDLINEITDENRPPNNNNNRFAPISPVFSNQVPHRPLHSNSTSNFLDMMMNGQDGTGGIMRSGSIRDLEGVGKLHNVEELEAKMRPSNPYSTHPQPGNKEEDMAAFKKLMMNKILQQQQLAQNLQQGVHQLPPGVAGPWSNLLAAQSNSNYQELVHKMVKIQQAQEYQRRMASLGLSNRHSTPGIPPELQHHLLNNPQFDARNLVRLFQQRIPSPNQLAAHTQSILQNAIIKKKMEEQKEALRKRQELLQRAQSPSVSMHHHHPQQGPNLLSQGQQGPNMLSGPGHEPRPSNASPVIAAFTPTSVLRKMTAAHPQEQPEKDMLMNQNHSQSPWSRPQTTSSLAHKNNLINLGNQQIPGQPHLSNPRSKFTLSSKQSTKSSGYLAQSLADQMNMMSQELNMKSPAQHPANPFTSHLPSHHSQAGGQQVMEQLEKWFSPELLARSQAQAPMPAQNILSVEELERLASRGGQTGRSNAASGAPPSAEAVQN